MKFIQMLVLMLAMVSVSSLSYVFAAVPAATDRANVTVKNVESGTGVEVIGYRIISPKYSTGSDTGGLTGYEMAYENMFADIENPTEEEISAIVAKINNRELQIVPETFTYNSETTDYELKNVAAGTYLVLVTGTDTTIYNPMVVSAGYSPGDSTLKNGSVDASDTKLYAKKMDDPSVEKEIVSPGSNNSNGDDLARGDKQSFKISTTIPSYTDAYTNAVFTITDTLQGLTLDQNSIFVLNTDVDPKSATDAQKIAAGTGENANYTITKSATGFEIAFTSKYILDHGNGTVVVRYDATLNDDSEINFDANKNKAVLEYSSSPKTNGGASNTKTDEDTTYHYTFGIDADLGGSITGETTTEQTKELVKVNEDGTTETTTTTETGDPVTNIEYTALSGAKFLLKGKNGKEYTATTDGNGYLKFEGLDAGEYTLEEIEAPNGYTLDTTKHPVVISAEYNADGTLKSYSITIDGKATSTYTATYEGGTIKSVDTSGGNITTFLKNTKIKALPSTGGMGTYIFTILGVFIMVGSAYAYMERKKKRSKETE